MTTFVVVLVTAGYQAAVWLPRKCKVAVLADIFLKESGKIAILRNVILHREKRILYVGVAQLVRA